MISMYANERLFPGNEQQKVYNTYEKPTWTKLI